MKKRLLLVLLLATAIFFFRGEEKTPSAVYLTWLRDPTTTMTVQWQCGNENAALVYQREGEESWLEVKGSSHHVAEGTLLWGKLFVNTVEITGLLPDTTYAFRVAKDSSIYRFRTMPQNGTRPLHFVVGGDVYQHDIFLLKKMNAQVAKMDPDFVILGGDIAYTRGHNALLKGRYFEMRRWHTFFKQWKQQMVTSDGRLIPLVAVLGNHDVSSRHLDPKNGGALFYELFAFPNNLVSYRTLDFGDELSLFFLDTGHTYPVVGKQTTWLKEALEERKAQQHKMVVYHVAAYPSVSRPDKKCNKLVRKHWAPLFEEHGVKTVFEHHDHAYKRTHPIKGEKIDPEGVVYLGDGGWASVPREPLKADERWYLAKTARANFVYFVSLQDKNLVVQGIDNEGHLIDQITLSSTANPLTPR